LALLTFLWGTCWIRSCLSARVLFDRSLLPDGEVLGPDDSVHVLIGYHSVAGEIAIRQTCDNAHKLGLVSAMATTLNSTAQLLELEGNPFIDYIEEDPKYYLLQLQSPGQYSDPALDVIQARTADLPSLAESGVNLLGNCDDPLAFRVAVVDSGVDRTHPDIACDQNRNCVGKSFGESERQGLDWGVPADGHGKLIYFQL